MIDVYWLSRHPHIQSRGPWDTGMLEWLFAGTMFDTGYDFVHHEVDHLEPGRAGIVVLPARHHAADVDWLNGELAKLERVLLILCGDEEAVFDWRQVDHGRIQFWVQLPNLRVHSDMPWAYFFGDGWNKDVPHEIGPQLPEKDILWSFAGQVTNARRKRAVNGLTRARARIPGKLLCTEGFTQGMPRAEYLQQLKRTWVAPCPGGPATHDTFRFFEALHASCIPVFELDLYWDLLSSQAGVGPLPPTSTNDWEGVGGTIAGLLDERLWWSNYWQVWYSAYRRQMSRRLVRDIERLEFGDPDLPANTTAIITCSPSPLHPDASMIAEVILSVRRWAGRIPIVVVADGVRPEAEHLRARYDEFLFRLHWAAKIDGDTQVIGGWGEHRHQVAGTREALTWVDTPNILFLEHDTPLTVDAPIDWAACEELVEQGAVDVLRFHHEAHIHPEHEHLMIDHRTIEMMDVPLRRTVQWSQRPHLAGTAYYERMLAENFSADARCFIEDRMHSVAQRRRREHRIAIYAPEGNLKRSYHLDGRQGEPKHDADQVF